MATRQNSATENSDKAATRRKRAVANLKPFPKGVSGNPGGRPKSATLSEAIRAKLAEIAPGKSEQTVAEVIAAALCFQAAKGNVLAAKEIADRTEGKARQSVDVDMNVRDWRELARQHKLSEQHVIDEARRIIESVDDSGDA